MKSTSSPRPLRAWWLAARPKTLSGALVPVVTGAALALAAARSGHVAALQPHAAVAGGLCALFAALMQIASNFINDLIDYRRGADGNDRLGPERACAQGWITPRAMTRGIVGILVLAALTGLALATLLLCALPIPPLALLAGLVLTGATCMAGAFLYTTHLSRLALGDVLVFVFFGIVPVVGTFFALTGRFTATAFLLGVGVGAMVDTLLVVNNLRDIDNDRRVGKRTLIVLIGRPAGHRLYLLLGLLAMACTFATVVLNNSEGLFGGLRMGALLLLSAIFLVLHGKSSRYFESLPPGREMNEMLGITSRNMLCFALITVVALLWIG